MRKQTITITVFSALALSGCSGGGNSPSPAGVTTASPIVRTFTFPQGDAKTPTSGTAFDIIGVKTTLSSQYGNANGDAYDYLTIETTFAQDISNAFPMPRTDSINLNPDQLLEFVAFETGQNPTFTDCASTAVRDDNVSISNTDANDNYPITYSNAVLTNSVHGSTLTQSVPLGGINVHAGSAIPHLGIVIGVSNGGQGSFFTTDCVPSSGSAIMVGS